MIRAIQSLVALSFVLSVPILHADAAHTRDFCQNLEKSIELTLGAELPHEVDAGTGQHAFTIKYKVINPEFFHNIRLALWHNFGTNIPGSSSITFFSNVSPSELAELPAGGVISFSEVLDIPKNMMGIYKFRTGVHARGAHGEFCATYNFPSSTPREFIVRNTDEQADIMPPQVSAVELSKNEVSPGEKIYLKFFVSDKSEICTHPRALVGECGGIWHVAFELQNSDEAINDYQPIMAHPDGYYLTEFTIPKDSLPGTYHLRMLDVGDIYDNLAAEVRAEEMKELTIRKP